MNNPPSPRHGPLAPRGASDSAAALQGANLAFMKSSKPKPIPPANKLASRNSALTAATTSASRDRSRSRSPVPPLTRQMTGGSSRSLAEHYQYGKDGASDSISSREQSARFGSSPSASATMAAALLQPSSAAGAKPTVFDSKSTSFIAATLAASRSASPSPQIKGPGLGSGQPSASATHAPMFSRSHRGANFEPTSMSSSAMPDTSSIAPTTSLISMFEGPQDGQAGNMDPVKKGLLVSQQKTPTKNPREKPPLRPMTPERSISPKTEQIVPTLLPAVNTQLETHSSSQAVKLKPKLSLEPKARSQPANDVANLPMPATPPAQAPQGFSKAPAVPRSPKVTELSGSDMESRKPADKSQERRGGSPNVLRPPPPPKSEWLLIKTAQPDALHSPAPTLDALQIRPSSQPKPRPPTPPQPRVSTAFSRTTPRRIDTAKPAQLSKSTPSSSPENRPTTASTTSSNDTFVSASSNQTPVPRSPPRREPTPLLSTPASTNAGRGSPTRTPAPPLPRRTPTSASSSSLPLHSLSNAIMAGSLAAARLTPSNTGASSVSLGPAPTLPRHGKSPRLRQTLRQPVSLSDDETEARRIKKHHGHHTHSNKKHFHHEGARKRWREEIKPTERKRYEALWASNRGLLAEYLLPSTTSSTDTVHLAARKDITLNNSKLHAFPLGGLGRADVSECVINVVVREIWRRCRLPDDELAEVWELVSNHAGSGRKDDSGPIYMLDKQQFVVGMWIIDQRLRGRKIPTKVSASVWDSAKCVRVSSPKSRKDGTKMRK